MKLNRRKFLAGAGSLLCLPQLESFGAAEAAQAPARLVFLGFGYGFTDHFYPKTFGKDYKLTPSLASLEKHKGDFSMINNLYHQHSKSPHSGSESYLTGADVLGTPGKKFHNTISVDQVAAPLMGRDTRYTSLQLSSSDNAGHGHGASLSWNASGKSISGINSSFALFNMLFGGGSMKYEERMAMLQQRKSVLDAYLGSIKSMRPHTSRMDNERLDQYFQSLREIEVRIAKEKLWAKKPKPIVDYKVPDVDRNGVDEIRTMYELMVLAMQTDSSRVFTYRQPLGGLLKAIGLTANPHELSHWSTSEANIKANFQRELKQTELLAHFFDRLKETKDIDGSRIFDNCLVSYGSNIRSGHAISNVPAFIAGNIDNRLKHGQHIEMPKNSPLCNLWLTMLKTAGIQVDSFSDSTGTISELIA